MASDPKQRLTLHDYLALERQAETKSEYHVEHYTRQGKDRWILLEIESLDHRLELPSIGCTLGLAEIYEEAFEDQPAS